VLRRVQILALVCVAAVAETSAQTNTWRQCLADTATAAVAACTSIIVLDPHNDGAFVNRGLAYRRLGQLDRAIRDYEAAIRLNARAADAFNNRGNAYQDKLDYERALADYDEAIRLNPRYAHAYNNRGVVFLELGDSLKALADFHRAINEDPFYANAFRNRGLAHTDQEEFDLAVEDYDEAFRLNPAVPHGVEYAVALFGRGDVAAATRLVPNIAELMKPR